MNRITMKLRQLILSAAAIMSAATCFAQDFQTQWIVPKKTSIENAKPKLGNGSVTPLEHGWQVTIPVGTIPAGTWIEWDFSASAKPDAPEFYALEYMDGGQWKSCGTFQCTLTKGTSNEVSGQITSFRLENAATGSLQLRMSATVKGEGRPEFVHGDNSAMMVRTMPGKKPESSLSVLCIGNSFTYVAGCPWMLKAIAWSQGLFLDTQVALKGGRTFGQHLNLSVTKAKMERGGYDVAFLQNQSQTNAWYAQDRKGKAGIMQDGVALAGRVREASPKVRLYMESTWAYVNKDGKFGGFSSMEQFDKLLVKGTKIMAKKAGCKVSPIGEAFRRCRAERPDINLYAKDKKHQGEYGSYLKACVNYLLISGKKFEGKVDDFALDPEKTAYLRGLAEKVVKP